MADEERPFEDVRLVPGGFSIPELRSSLSPLTPFPLAAPIVAVTAVARAA